MFVQTIPDPRDSNRLVAKSLLDGYESRFVVSSHYGRRNSVGEVVEHNQKIVSYLVDTGQIAANESDPAVIGKAWTNRKTVVDRLPAKFYITQHGEYANRREVRSLIDGHRIPYHSIDVAKALAEMEAYNAELVRLLIEFKWLETVESHNLAAVVRAYKNSIGEN